ncbi:MAG TPA: serine protease [Vicinamibacterales bacterium]|nr:serine protease [Vicinamibacterales bacterium]
MLRPVAVVALAGVMAAAAGQELGTLQIRIVLVDSQGSAVPVARHGLLVSENPASAAPRLVLTAHDGTATVKLRPGNYTVESERAVRFAGRAYEWRQVVDIAAGRDVSLDLTVENAEIAAAAGDPGAPDPSPDTDGSFLLPQWQGSVVAVWTPRAHASGFVIDARGLIATSLPGIGSSSTVEVQPTPSLKVAGTVLAANHAGDVAVVRVDPEAIAGVKPVPLSCVEEARAIAGGDDLFAVGVSLRLQRGLETGTVSRLEGPEIESTLLITRESPGGPVFTSDGRVVGLTTPAADRDGRERAEHRIARTAAVCEVLAAAEPKMRDGEAPPGLPLPTEPLRPFPVDALKAAADRGVRSLSPYQISSSAFDVTFVTPPVAYAMQYQSPETHRTTSHDTRKADPDVAPAPPRMEFGHWSAYVADFPPVLLVRVTPKAVEGFWTTVARGAASTQGISIPAIKRYSSGFSRLQAFCGPTEVMPIHRFTLDMPISETETMLEGLYVYDPGAFGPACAEVRLVLYSEKEPENGDTRVVDSKVVQRVWDDFAAYRR